MALLNWDLFLERVEGNESLALELAYDLLLCVDSYLENLEYAIAGSYRKQIEHSAHALRGLIAPYGGVELTEELKMIEEEARAGEAPTFVEIPLIIRTMVIELKAELRAKLANFQPKLPIRRRRPEHSL